MIDRILTLKVVDDLPVVPGCHHVSPQTPGLFVAYGALVDKAYPAYAYIMQVSGTTFHVFSEHMATIDPLNAGQTLADYYSANKQNWKHFRCNGQRLIEGKWVKTTGFNYKYTGDSPNTDPSAISPWQPEADVKVESAKPTIPTSIGPTDLSELLPKPTITVVEERSAVR